MSETTVPIAPTTITVPVAVRIVRVGRQRCAVCHQRRIVYGVEVSANQQASWPSGRTELRCAACWGMYEPPAEKQSWARGVYYYRVSQTV
jgi:hypothetical protein